MHRSTILGVVATALLSIAVSLIAASLFLHPLPATGHSAATAGVVQQFYAAANEAIATGDAAALRQIVAPHFVDREPLPGVGSGRDGMEAYLFALHAANPDLRVVAEPVLATDDRAVMRVTLEEDRARAPLANAIVDGPTPWGAVDVFRVTGGKIVERWSDTGGVALVRPLAALTLELPAPAHRMITLERRQIARGAGWQSRAIGYELLVLESGSLRVEGTPLAAGMVDSPPKPVLSAGQSLVIPPFSDFSIANMGDGAAQLLIVTFAVPTIPAGEPPAGAAAPAGVTSQILAGELATDVGVGPADLELARVTLGPDAPLAVSSADGPVLIAVEAGQPRVTAWGRVWTRRGSDGMSRTFAAADLTAGDGLLLHSGSQIIMQSGDDDPVTALVLTLRPAAGSG